MEILMDTDKNKLLDSQSEESIQEQINSNLKSEKKKKFISFILSALSSIPWVGGLFSAISGLKATIDQSQVNELHIQWLEEHKHKLENLGNCIFEITQRIDDLGDEAQSRVDSKEYLELVRQGFRVWDNSSTDEKKKYIQHLLSNAAGTTLCSDDVLRLFIEWIDKYHEMHFSVIREIYKSPGITRGEIWHNIRGTQPKDDSAEADIFKLLMRDLSTGGIIRQHRETNEYGQYLAKGRTYKRTQQKTLKSPFDNIEPYELTELGNQFIHYTMEDIAPRLESNI
jgi:hypothetical protein